VITVSRGDIAPIATSPLPNITIQRITEEKSKERFCLFYRFPNGNKNPPVKVEYLGEKNLTPRFLLYKLSKSNLRGYGVLAHVLDITIWGVSLQQWVI